MTYQELLDLNKKRNIVQLGIVTNDIERSMRDWVEKLKIGPWRYKIMSNESVKDATKFIDGETVSTSEPFAFYNALTEVGNLQIELIQPLYGPTIYQKFLDEKGEGIHHFKEKII